MQAIVLSFAGLQFTSEHLALGTDPEVLHNEIGLSNIRYRNSSLNINLVKEDGTDLPDIHVKTRPLSKYSEKLYACEVIQLTSIFNSTGYMCNYFRLAVSYT